MSLAVQVKNMRLMTMHWLLLNMYIAMCHSLMHLNRKNSKTYDGIDNAKYETEHAWALDESWLNEMLI